MTDTDFLALHGLAVRKAADPTAVAELLGIDEAEIVTSLERAVVEGRAAGAKGMFMVSAVGQRWLAEQYPLIYAGARSDGELNAACERFEKVNTDLLALFTDWQTIPIVGGSRIPNDHYEMDYDQGIIDRLGDLHVKAERVIARCSHAQPRLSRYLVRLEIAYDRVLAGNKDYVSGVRIDSYHTVWFELHEDLLRILGRTRQE